MKGIVDPPGRIGGHYFHTWCPSVRPSVLTEYIEQLQRYMGSGGSLNSSDLILCFSCSNFQLQRILDTATTAFGDLAVIDVVPVPDNEQQSYVTFSATIDRDQIKRLDHKQDRSHE